MGYVNSLTANATTGTQVTNSDTPLWTADKGAARVMVKCIVLTNTTSSPVTCQITDGDSSGSNYKLLLEADACIVPYIDDADYKLKSIRVVFEQPYLVTKDTLYATTGVANGCKAVVYTI